MYLIRNIDKQVKKWIDSGCKKPLFINGCRQCGKTTTVTEIAHQNFKNVYKINFLEKSNLVFLKEFKQMPSVDNLIKAISNIYGNLKIDEESIIIVDEVQEVLEFFSELKTINESYKNLNLIVLGSYLGMTLANYRVSVPVGQYEQINMYTLGFDEFLKNCNLPLYQSLVKDYDNKLISAINHQLALKYFNDYLIIGGYPETIVEYLNHHQTITEDVLKINKQILLQYREDITKYIVSDIDKLKTQRVFDNALMFMSKPNNTFTLSTIKTNARYRDYEKVFQMLNKSHIFYKVDNCQNLTFPLKPKDSSNKFKIYLTDVGLISSYYGINQNNYNNETLKTIKGSLCENFVISEVYRHQIKPYYNTFNINTNIYEIDCVYEQDLNIYALEIKNGFNKKSPSLNKIKSDKNVNWLLSNLEPVITPNRIPIYLIFLLFRKH